MLVYLGIGLVALLVMLQFNLRRFTPDSWIYRMLVFKHNRNASNGWPWVVLAATLLAMTIKFGTGPEGSGVKVNLFGFQPSEIVKYLIILFLAGFFAANEKLISEYTQLEQTLVVLFLRVDRHFSNLIAVPVTGRSGPAMVVCFTFIVLFSFSRGDFMFMAGAVVLYVIVSWVVKNVWLSALITATIAALFMLFKRRQLSESAMMVLIIMAAFLTIDQIPYLGKLFPGPVQRLVDRKAIWQDAWNNEVYGGDQVANGLWAMSSGGVSGQGVGEGFAKTIPEAHILI
jgi:cell division protein FtsW (lipid II flippase)